MKNIIKLLTPKHDKIAHYFTGEYPAIAGLLIYFFIWENLIALVLLSVLAGLYKEIYHDKWNGKGRVEIMDFVFTVLPSVRNLIFILIL